MNQSVVYYTDNTLQSKLMQACASRLIAATDGMELITVSHSPVEFGENIVFGAAPRSLLTVYKQIVGGLEACSNEQVFLAEHDVLYPPERFYFRLPEGGPAAIHYNTNVHRMNSQGFFDWHNDILTSNLTAPCEYLLECLRWRIKQIEGGKRFLWSEPAGFEDDWQRMTHRAAICSIDIRHGGNLTGNRNATQFGYQLNGWPLFGQLKAEIGLE